MKEKKGKKVKHDSLTDSLTSSCLFISRELARAHSRIDPLETAMTLALKIPGAFGFDAAAVYILDEGGEELSLRASSGISGRILYGRIGIDFAEIYSVLSGTVTRLAADVSPHPLFAVHSPQDIESPEASLFPVFSRGEAIGFLALFSKNSVNLSEQEYSALTSLLEQAGVAIENTCLYRQQSRHLSYLRILNDITKAINSTHDLQRVLDLIVNLLPKALSVKGCTIRLLNPKDRRLELVASSGLSSGYLARGSIDSERSVHETIFGRRPIIIYDAAEDPRISFREEARKEGIGGILSVPVFADGGVLGVLRLITDRPRIFSEIEIDFAMAVAEHGGIAMKKARDYGRITTLLSEIEQQEAFLASIIDHVSAGLMILDNSGRIVMVNNQFLHQHGLSPVQSLGKKPDEILQFITKDAFTVLQEETLLEEKTLFVEERKGGGTRFFEMTATPFSPPGAENDFTIVIMRDVTAAKLLEREMIERERLQGVVEMARTVAHELNTPIFVALGSLDLLEDDLPEASPLFEESKSIRMNLQKISELITKMTRITQYKPREYVGDVTMVDLERSAPFDEG